MKISVFGMGYVGAVSAACLTELGHDVVGVDIAQAKVDLINSGQSPIVEPGVSDRMEKARAIGRIRATTEPAKAVAQTDVSMISVGTPSASDGSPSLTALEAVISDIGRALRTKPSGHTVIVRSTVLPGTTEDILAPALSLASRRDPGRGLEIAFNPEFLREGAAVNDFFHPPFTIAGCMNRTGINVVRELYEGIKAPLIHTECRVAESIKYVSNAFHAIKITFANEIGILLKSLGVDGRETMRIFCEDHALNISSAYLRPGFAFGGSCLPKELRALQALARKQHIELPVLFQVLNSNQKIVDLAFEKINRFGRSRVAMYGLAFKSGTDDMRESPLVSLAERLIGKGYELSIFDRQVETARLVGSNRDYIKREIPHFEEMMVKNPTQALIGANVVVIGHVGFEEIAAIKAVYRNLFVVDLQGVKEIQDLPDINYEGIAW